MAEDKKLTAPGHHVFLQERRSLTVTGVLDIGRFDEEEIAVMTDMGELSIKGQGLHLNRVDVEDGELTVEGVLDSLTYSDAPADRGGFLARLFR